MRLSKKQLDVVEEMQKGGYIWLAGEHAYLACKLGEQFKSRLLNLKTLTALEQGEVVVWQENSQRYVLPHQL